MNIPVRLRRCRLVLVVALAAFARAGLPGFAQATSPSPWPYTAVPDAKRYVAIDNVCAWPMLTSLHDGSILATIHNEPSHGLHEADVDCWVSADGEFWRKAGTPAPHAPDTARMNIAVGLARNGDLVVLSSGWSNQAQPGKAKQSPFRDAILRNWVCRSGDNGKTWQVSTNFPAPDPGTGEYVPFGDILAADDGSLRVCCYAETRDARQRGTGHASFLFRSDDDGRTWTKSGIVAPLHDETALFHLAGAHWLAAARFKAVDLYRSDDDGRTWRNLGAVTETNQVNGHLLRLRDGRLMLAYTDRVKGQYGVDAKLSADDGATWGPPLRLADSIEGDCGYPSSVQRQDGKIVTAFYSKGVANHQRYHMGVVIWAPPPATATKY